MANYNVGNLEIGLKFNSDNTISKITELTKKLQELKSANKSTNSTNRNLDKLSETLKKISKLNIEKLKTNVKGVNSTLKSLGSTFANFEGVDKLKTVTNSFSRLTTLLNKLNGLKSLNDADFEKLKNVFESMTASMTPFLNKLKESEASLVSMSNLLKDLKARTITKANKEIAKTTKELDKANKKAGKTMTLFRRFIGYAVTRTIYTAINRIGTGMAQLLKYSIDFEETLNKFKVSFNDLYEESEIFVNKLTYAFNTSSDSIMNYMASFNSMLKALKGLDTNEAARISQTLTHMALDYASLYNLSIETSMSQFQSMLSGMSRPIRSSSGIDATDNTIYEYYKELGGTKTLSGLTQVEKRLLRILAVQKQMDAVAASQDLERTIDSPSNMLKQMGDTAKELGKWLGLLIKDYFEPVIRFGLSTILVLKDIAKAVAELRGLEYNTPDALIEEINDDLEDTNNEVDKLLGKLSFDRFEALNSSSSTDNSDIALISKAIADYAGSLSEISSKARAIADSVLTWLGFTQEVNEETGEITIKFGEGLTNLRLIKGTLQYISVIVGVLIAKAAAGAIYKAVQKLVTGTSILNSQLAKTMFVATYIFGTLKVLEMLNQMDNATKKWAGTLTMLVGVLGNAIIAYAMFKGLLTGGTAIPVMLANLALIGGGVKAMVEGFSSIDKYANGGFPTKGNLFIANEAGPELVGNIGGNTAVVNNNMIIQGIEEASYKGFMRAMSSSNGMTNINLNVSGIDENSLSRAIFKPMLEEARRNGYRVNKN